MGRARAGVCHSGGGLLDGVAVGGDVARCAGEKLRISINRRDDDADVNRRAFRCWPAVTERSKRCVALASSAQSRRGCGRGGPSPGCGRGGPSPGANVTGVT